MQYKEIIYQSLWDIAKPGIPSSLKKKYSVKIRKILAKLSKIKYINKINSKNCKKRNRKQNI